MDYDQAIAEGRSAAIAEEERPDVFTIRVGNIPATSLARVEFTLVAPLAIDGLEATFRFPLVVAERYCPGAPLDGDPVGDGVLADTDLVPDASRISPPVFLPGFPNPVRLGIRVSIGRDLLAADALRVAASIPAREERDESRLLVIADPGQRLDRDFILRWPLPASALAVGMFTIEPDAMPGVVIDSRGADRTGQVFAATVPQGFHHCGQAATRIEDVIHE
jgi:Ca-activated chloride channel family protein